MTNTILENDIRLFIYQHFVKNCRAPSIKETADTFKTDLDRILTLFKTLEQKHIIVLDSEDSEIKMAMPFSAKPTEYQVTIGESSWWAN